MNKLIEDNGLHYLVQKNGTRTVVRDESFFKRTQPTIAASYRVMKAREIGSCQYTVLGETIDPQTGEVIEKVEIRFKNRPQGGGYLDNGQSIDGILGVNRADQRTLAGDLSQFENRKYVSSRQTSVAVIGYRRPFESTIKYGSCLLDEIESARWILPEEVEQRVQGISLADRFKEGLVNTVHVSDTNARFNNLELD